MTEAPEPGLNSPTAAAGSKAPATSRADKLYAPELTACKHALLLALRLAAMYACCCVFPAAAKGSQMDCYVPAGSIAAVPVAGLNSNGVPGSFCFVQCVGL